MRFAFSSAAFLAFASSALAQTSGFDPITVPTNNADVPAGQTLTVQWEPSTNYTGTVSLLLLGGATPSTLELGPTIASGLDNSAGKYDWAVSSTLGADATYGLKLVLDSDTTIFQYSFPFHITGGSTNSSSTTGSTSTGSSATGSVSKTGSSTTVTTSSGSSTSSSLAAPTSTFSTVTPAGNLSTTATGGPTKVTLTSTTTGSGASKTTGPSTVATGAAATMAVGSVAMLGGLAMAVLAL